MLHYSMTYSAPCIAAWLAAVSLLFPSVSSAQEHLSPSSLELSDVLETYDPNRSPQGFTSPLSRGIGNAPMSLVDSLLETDTDISKSAATLPPLVSLDPVHAPAHYALSAVVTYNYGVARLHGGDVGGAIHEWQTVLGMQPDMAEALVGLGAVNIVQGELAVARNQFSRAVSLRSDWPEAWNGLGLASYRLGRIEEARDAWEHAVTLKPDYAEAFVHLGRAHAAEGNFGHALKAFASALDAQPDSPRAHYYHGLTLSKLGRWNAAIPHFEESLRREPTMAAAAIALGHAQAATGDWPEALQTWRDLTALDLPNNHMARVHFLSGQLLWQLGQAKPALEEFRHAAARQPDFVQAHFHAGAVLLALHRWEKAGEAFQRVIDLDPTWPLAYLSLGNALFQQQNLTGALTAYREATRLAPAWADAQLHMGVTLVTLNRSDEAALHIQRAAEAGLAEAEDLLGSFYFTGNGVRPNIPEAMKWWGRAARHDVGGSAALHAQEQLSRLRRRIFHPQENASVIESIREGFTAIQADLRALYVSTLSVDQSDQSVGMTMIQNDRVEEGMRLLLAEAYALHPQAFRDLTNLYEEGLENRLVPHDPRILLYLIETAQEGSAAACRFLNGLSQAELAASRQIPYNLETLNHCHS